MTAGHLHVRLGPERYALPVETVLEVAPVGDLTPVPGAAATILGVRNLRGRILPVIDLAAVVGVARDGPARAAVIVEHRGRTAGLAVDAVIDVATVAARLDPAESRLVTGTVLLDGALVGVLDVGAALDAVEAR